VGVLESRDGGEPGVRAAGVDAGVDSSAAVPTKEIARPLEMPPAPPPGSLPAPPVFEKLATATALELHDEWVGLGRNHDVVVRLDLTGDTYAFRAKVSESGASIGESVHDPSAPRDNAFTCACPIDKTCPCEGKVVERVTGTVPATMVHDFLQALATHGFPPPLTPGTMGKHESLWTDDYPRGHVTVFLPDQKAPLHFSFWDQKRQWRFNGKPLSAEPPKPDAAGRSDRISHPYTWALYRRLLERTGLSERAQKKDR